MQAPYAIADTSRIFSPALLFYKDLIRQNVARAVELVGSPARLRPHAKTHKTPEVARIQIEAGITKHKCATLAEAEMLAKAGAADVLLAYQPVGPNCKRLAQLIRTYRECRFSALADHPAAAEALSAVMSAERLSLDVLLDVDVGQHRTGIAPGPGAVALYELIDRLPGLQPAGLHVYDGHNQQEHFPERQAAALRQAEPALELRRTLERKGLPVPKIVMGGTPTFPVYARLDLPGLECSPGTFVLHDHNYNARFADLSGFVPAALLLTRVVSRPTPSRVTLDLGSKAVASDPPAGKRCRLLDVPDCEAVVHSEEHLVVETPAAERFQPGDEVLAIPAHVCPTVALHRFAHVIEGGRLVGSWEVMARERVLTV